MEIKSCNNLKICIIIFLIVSLGCYFSSREFGFYLYTITFLLFSGCLIKLIFEINRNNKNRFLIGLSSMIICIVVYVISFKYFMYEVRILDENKTTMITYKIGDKPVEIWVWNKKLNYIYEVPLSETGKWHGQMKWFDENSSRTNYYWYWYGEEVTEGQWHRFNAGK